MKTSVLARLTEQIFCSLKDNNKHLAFIFYISLWIGNIALFNIKG